MTVVIIDRTRNEPRDTNAAKMYIKSTTFWQNEIFTSFVCVSVTFSGLHLATQKHLRLLMDAKNDNASVEWEKQQQQPFDMQSEENERRNRMNKIKRKT